MIYPMYALAVAHANDFAGEDEFVRIAGGLLLLYGFGTMVGPMPPPRRWTGSHPRACSPSPPPHLVMAAYIYLRMRAAPAGGRHPRDLPRHAGAEDGDTGERRTRPARRRRRAAGEDHA